MPISLWRCIPLRGKMFYLVWRKLNLIGTPLCYANKSVSLTNVGGRTVHIHYFLFSNTFSSTEKQLYPTAASFVAPRGGSEKQPPSLHRAAPRKISGGIFFQKNTEKVYKKYHVSMIFYTYRQEKTYVSSSNA